MSKLVTIEEKSIAAAWSQLIKVIYQEGELFIPDYGVPTKRVHATIHITDPDNNQLSEYAPFKENFLDKYREELTEEYADWYMSLPDDDKRKFEYCYAKQLFRYGDMAFNTIRENIRNLRIGSRRHVGILWDNTIHIPKYEDQPCWIAYKLEKISEKEVLLYILYRSWDAFGGFPANIPGILAGVNRALQIYGSPDMKVSEIIATGWNTHAYEADLANIGKIMSGARICDACHCFKKKSSLRSTPKGYVCPACLG